MARIGRTAPVSSFLVDQPTPVYKQLALQLNTPGTFAFKVPAGVNFVDVVLIGGGGGGNGGSSGGANAVGGGLAGTWARGTFAVGPTIPAGSVINLVVGAGAPGGPVYGFASGSGGSTTATASGWAGLSAAGGASGANASSPSGATPVPQTLIYNNHAYPAGAGGGSGYNPANNGGLGAGGGTGNYLYTSGGTGGSGAAWIYTYTNVDVPPQGLSQMPTSSAVGMARL